MIEIEGLRKVYGETVALDHLNFTVAEGQTLALVGTSGSGKTTTLKMLNRLVEPSAGSIRLNGEDIRQLPLEVMRRRMGYVIQQVGLFPHYSVADNVAIVPRLLGWSPPKIQATTRQLLDRLGLPAATFLHRMPAELSGGQRQRVGIARALAADPPVVLMDEPFSALDPITRAELRRDFRELDTLKSKTVILVTHDVAEAFELADQVCLLDAGKLQQLGTPRELLFRPNNDFVRRFLADEQLTLAKRVLTVEDLAIRLRAAEADTVQLAKDTTLAVAEQELLRTQIPGQRRADGAVFTLTDIANTIYQHLARVA
ncbi:MAG: ABC transporter ATP-binding protein [Bacteroidota bacterium]